jgi:hypothetical protein
LKQLCKKRKKNLLRDAEKGLISWTSEEFIMVLENIRLMTDNNIFPVDVTKRTSTKMPLICGVKIKLYFYGRAVMQ